MLKRLQLQNVGPAPMMGLDFAPRLNLITGDNGLGKSFLLDVAWWALTRNWPQDLNDELMSGYPARPTDLKTEASIDFEVVGKTKTTVSYRGVYRPQGRLGGSGRTGSWPAPHHVRCVLALGIVRMSTIGNKTKAGAGGKG